MKKNQFLSLKIGGWYIFYRIYIQMFLNYSPKEKSFNNTDHRLPDWKPGLYQK